MEAEETKNETPSSSIETTTKERFKENVVLVLGATGKTGQNLVNQLADKQGYNIRVMVRYDECRKISIVDSIINLSGK